MVTPNLPWELESEILSRVTPTSLKQLQLTCKRWYDLFKDPIFIIKNHLGKTATQMILKNDESVFSFSFSFHESFHNQVIKLTGKLQSLKDSEDVKINEIFHCKGLLLCKTEDNGLVLWNPCTGQTRWIQSEPYYPRCYLGYENNNKSCDSYKILSFRYSYRGNIRAGKYEIYEFNSDSWRVLDAISDDWSYLWHDLAISLKGDTYWLESNTSIVRFDFTTEKFERLPLPSTSDEHNRLVFLSTVREEKLALLRQYSDNRGSLKMKIWLTNTNTDDTKDLSWSEFLVCKVVIHGMTSMKSFLVDEENKKVLCCYTDHEYRTRIYIVGEDTYKNIYIEDLQEPRSRVDPRLFSYVPSLVQIPISQRNPCCKRKRCLKKRIKKEKGFRSAIFQASEAGLSQICIKSDCQALISALSSKYYSADIYGEYLSSTFKLISFCFIPRSQNSKADSMAKFVLYSALPN